MQKYMLAHQVCFMICFWGMVTSSVLALEFAGGRGEPNDPYQIATIEQFAAISENEELYDKSFLLVADIDFDPNLPGGRLFDRAVIAPVSIVPMGRGPLLAPIEGLPFTGDFDGNNHRILNLHIAWEQSHTSGANYPSLGLFGAIADNALIQNLRIEDVDVNGVTESVGALAGIVLNSTVLNCHSSGTVRGSLKLTGGLIGRNQYGRIVSSSSTCLVYGQNYVGGLLGYNSSGEIFRCSSYGSVTGQGYSRNIGGLVGHNGGLLAECVSFCNTEGWLHVGGLAGENLRLVADCYSGGSVKGIQEVGGLIGSTRTEDIVRCFSTCTVLGDSEPGGLIGQRYSGQVLDCFWDIDMSGQIISDGGTGLITSEMLDITSYLNAGWDFSGETKNGTQDIWIMPEEPNYPMLWWENDKPEDVNELEN